MDPHIISEDGYSLVVPTEICEAIISAVYDSRFDYVPEAMSTLCSCSLVCRAWRPCAQKILFAHITVGHASTLHRLGEILQVSPYLGEYVRKLTLRGRHHVPYSSATLFPAVLRGKLPKLKELYILESYSNDPFRTVSAPDEIELPSLPTHKYLPSLLTSFPHIQRFILHNTTFSSFGELARILNVLQNLRDLILRNVSWVVAGQLPPCMSSKVGTRQGFLPNLEHFECYDVAEQGRQTLISALGPSLKTLCMNLPNEPSTRAKDKYGDYEWSSLPDAADLDVDLGSLPNLTYLSLRIAPSKGINAVLLPMQSMFRTWQTSDMNPLSRTSPYERYLYISPYHRANHTRESFARLLESVGKIVESTDGLLDTPTDFGVDEQPGAADKQVNPCRATVEVSGIRDTAKWETWWTTTIAERFPIFWEWRSLEIYPTKRASHDKWQETAETRRGPPIKEEILDRKLKDLKALQRSRRAARR